MDISLIGVPFMYGCDREGPQYGPDTLRKIGILEIIEKYNHKVYDFGNLDIPEIPTSEKYAFHEHIKYLKPIVNMSNNLAHLTYSTLSVGSFPFVIGGDHSIALGSISGASKYYNNLAVIWIDAHGDINTPKTSPSGNAHGMPLAALLGQGEASMVNVYCQGPKVKPENIYIIGARDLDEGEVKLAKDLNINLYTMDMVNKIGLSSVVNKVNTNIKSNNNDGVHLSFDIDALDKDLVPGTGTPVKDGFNLHEGKELLEGFLSTGKVNSMDFVELNPRLDQDNITVNNCIDLINRIFEIIK